MGLKAILDTERLSYVILGVSIITGAITSSLMLKIDSIIHVQLYDYGLQFSPEWANPYWAAARLIYVLLTLPMILGIIVLAIKLTKSRKERNKFSANFDRTTLAEKRQTATSQPKLQFGTVVPKDDLFAVSFDSEPEQPDDIEKAPRMREGNELLISCPNCSKMFNRPLVMLDFSSGKACLVNICPYCNHNLGEALEQRKKESVTDRSPRDWSTKQEF